jgi:hypothetical protein
MAKHVLFFEIHYQHWFIYIGRWLWLFLENSREIMFSKGNKFYFKIKQSENSIYGNKIVEALKK